MYHVGKKDARKWKVLIVPLLPTLVMGREPELVFLLNGHCHFIFQAGSE